MGTWNVRTVKDNSQLHILNEELVCWDCDIAGISETHRTGTEELYLGEYKFIAQGVEEGPSRSGVGMFLSKAGQKALEGYSPVSDQIILAEFTTMVGCLVVIQVYAPTTEATQQEVDSFYTLLQSTVNEQKDGAFLIIMGDFNAKLGTDWENADGAIDLA